MPDSENVRHVHGVLKDMQVLGMKDGGGVHLPGADIFASAGEPGSGC